MRVVSAGMTDIGCVRKHNEDNFFVDDELGLYLVADGLGGHAAGEVASQIVVDRTVQFIESTVEQDRTWPTTYDPSLPYDGNRLKAALIISDQAIVDNIRDNPERESMGSTVVACLLTGSDLTIVHVGDSRAYLIRDRQIQPLTRDHSWVAEQIECGLLTPEEARRHPFRNVITQALGNGGDMDIVVRPFQILPGDRILLCSDGLSGMIQDQEILRLVEESGEIPVAVERLVQAARLKGGEDNITVVIFGLNADGAPQGA